MLSAITQKISTTTLSRAKSGKLPLWRAARTTGLSSLRPTANLSARWSPGRPAGSGAKGEPGPEQPAGDREVDACKLSNAPRNLGGRDRDAKTGWRKVSRLPNRSRRPGSSGCRPPRSFSTAGRRAACRALAPRHSLSACRIRARSRALRTLRPLAKLGCSRRRASSSRGALGQPGEDVVLGGEHKLSDGQQLAVTVIREPDVVRDPRADTRNVLEEAVHLVLVAREDDHQVWRSFSIAWSSSSAASWP